MSFIVVSFWVETDYMSFIFVSCMRWDLFLLDVSFETHETWSLSCNIIYLSGLWTWENLWWVLCVWYICVVSIFIRTMHVLEWKCMVWCFYTDSCVIYLVICIMVFILWHTLAPHGCNDLGGSLLCVLICAIDIWGRFVNSIHKHILRGSLINHWIQKL